MSVPRLRSEALTAALKIDGWLTPAEGGLLYDLARTSKGTVVEIGSWQGRSTACLALGSMAGTGHPVVTIDPFLGPQEGSRPTSLGNAEPALADCSADKLRSNLDSAGVNGNVVIVPARSEEVAGWAPACGLLFVDGGHVYEQVKRDLDLYLPKVLVGGTVVLHDVVSGDPGVVKAVDECLMNNPGWRPRGRYDSAVAFDRVEPVQHSVYLAFPGRSFEWPVIRGLLEATAQHRVTVGSGGASGWDDFNYLWAQAHNDYEATKLTHFAMLHSDVVAPERFLDLLLVELDDRQASVISTVVPIKDVRGLTSCGVGSLANPWGALRRLTMHEVMELPETFGMADLDALWGTGYTQDEDKYLLFNTGCWACDLRDERLRAKDDRGFLKCYFDFPTRVGRNEDNLWVNQRESEDWFFSRQVARVGVKALLTRKVRLAHLGSSEFRNDRAWGNQKTDEGTKKQWAPGVATVTSGVGGPP